MEPATDLRSPATADSLREPALSATNLCKRYGDVLALHDLTFRLEPGSITGLLGPNGAGKTTTLRLVLGLAEPTSGSAAIFGQPYRELEHPSRRVGAVLESGDFAPGRSGRNHLRALALAAGIDFDRVEAVMALVQLGAASDRAVRSYSLGMRQRLGLAAALLGDPDLLILDEPGNGLDPAGLHWLRRFLRQFALSGRTVLVCSHVLAEVARTVDSVLILARGRLVAERRVDELDDPARELEALYLELTTQAAP